MKLHEDNISTIWGMVLNHYPLTTVEAERLTHSIQVLMGLVLWAETIRQRHSPMLG